MYKNGTGMEKIRLEHTPKAAVGRCNKDYLSLEFFEEKLLTVIQLRYRIVVLEEKVTQVNKNDGFVNDIKTTSIKASSGLLSSLSSSSKSEE